MYLLGNGIIITMGRECQVIDNGAVLIDGDTIEDLGSTDQMRRSYPYAEYIDCSGKIVMPGFLCVHTHTYSTFARGIGLKDAPPANFPEILQRLWWRLDKALTIEDVYFSALIPMIECVKNGTTAVLDHHASPNALTGSLAQIAKAAEQVGIRVNLCYEVTERDGEQKSIEGIEENIRHIKECQLQGSAMITGNFGMHASFTVGEKTMDKCARIIHDLGVGVHIHSAESRADVQDCKDKYGLGVIERLDKYDLLGPKTLTAHCIHIDEQEMDLLARTGTAVAHNPQSNMNNAVGCAKIKDMLQAGVMLGMGTDGMTTDMIEGLKTAHILHKFHLNDPNVGWVEVPEMQFVNNAKIMSNFFPVRMGELSKGAAADLVVVDYDPPTPLTANNYYGHIVFGLTGRMVDLTMVAGKILMKDKKVLGVDEVEINNRARELANKLWERF